MGRRIPLEPRYWAKVVKTPTCWLWTGAKTSRGYGVIQIAGKAVYVHRLALELDGRPLGPGQMACHHCDVPACVRPDHLFVGDVVLNAADMVAKGRSRTRPLTPDHIRKITEARRRYLETHPPEERRGYKTHCPQGHPYTHENTYTYRGSRHCRTCVLAQNRAAYWRRKSA